MVAILRALFGALLLCFPERMLRSLPHRRIDRPAELVARILGARHLAEAALLGRRRSRGWTGAALTVDAIHSLTALTVAAVDDRHRRLALTNGATAAAFALADAAELRGQGS